MKCYGYRFLAVLAFLLGFFFFTTDNVSASSPIVFTVLDTGDNSSVDVPLVDGSFFDTSLQNFGINKKFTGLTVSQPSNKALLLAGSFVIRAVDYQGDPLSVTVDGNSSFNTGIQYGPGANDYCRLFLYRNGYLSDSETKSVGMLFSFAIVFPERDVPANSYGFSKITFNLSSGNFIMCPGRFRPDGVDMGKLYFSDVCIYPVAPWYDLSEISGGGGSGGQSIDYTAVLSSIDSTVVDIYDMWLWYQRYMMNNVVPGILSVRNAVLDVYDLLLPSSDTWNMLYAWQELIYNPVTKSYDMVDSSGNYWEAVLGQLRTLNASNYERAQRQNMYDTSGAEDVTDKLWDSADFSVGLDLVDIIGLADYQSWGQDGADGILSWFSAENLNDLNRVGTRVVDRDNVAASSYSSYLEEVKRKLGR